MNFEIGNLWFNLLLFSTQHIPATIFNILTSTAAMEVITTTLTELLRQKPDGIC